MHHPSLHSSRPPERVVDVLKKARELIADPKRWTQGTFQDDGRYCGVGAVMYVTGNPNVTQPAVLALDEQARDRGAGQHFCDLNDSTDHATVLAAFDAAIKATS